MNGKLLRGAGIALLGLGALALGFYASWQWWQPEQRAGQPVPAITLTDLEGQPHALHAPGGKLLLVNFWASWCAPCMEEIPVLVDAQKRYGPRGLQVLGPALDTPEMARTMVQRLRINYPVMADIEGAMRASTALGEKQGVLPFSVLISREGRILETVIGQLDHRELQELVEPHL